MIVASYVDKASGTSYGKRVANYLERCRQNDLSLAGAITDVKGDRSKHPHEQADPDLYLRIVKERDDGIVVRGAKMHTTSAPYVDDLVILPTRAMTPDDQDYAVAFAIPVATKGLKLIARPMGSAAASAFENPLSSRHIHLHSLTIFDEVFVPWERVFLFRETQAAGPLAHYFAIWHRFTGVSYKAPSGDQLIGAAQLIAEYNGVADASHIRNKIAELIAYTECIRAHAKAAALDCKMIEGIAVPNPATINVGKYLFARGFHDAVRNVQDIAGGLTVTIPTEGDWASSQTKPYIEKYLKGAADVSTENRIKLFYLIRDLVAGEGAGEHQVVSLHGEGSLEAQRIAAYREYDLEKCKKLVKQWAGIQA
jgi:aromatic ring hydroxylase